MTAGKKLSVTLGILLVVGIYVYVYADWFRARPIQIFHRVASGRPMWGRGRTNQPQNISVVAFGFDKKCELTEVKVISKAALATNENPHPLWHLVSDSNSIPLKGFVYGDKIRGMKPYVKGARPQPLESNVTYRLFITAGSKKGEHDFSLGGNKTSR